MRVGITCYPTFGGSGAVATELGLELARRGHEIHVISGKTGPAHSKPAATITRPSLSISRSCWKKSSNSETREMNNSESQ